MSTFPDPEGWPYPWPFADEVELWRIPEEERQIAAEYEKGRRTAAIAQFVAKLKWEQGLVYDIAKEIPNTKFCNIWWHRPYLYNNEKAHGMRSAGITLAALSIDNVNKSLHLVPLGGKLHDIYTDAKCVKMELRLDPRASKGQVVKEFRELLDQMEKSGEISFSGKTQGKDSKKATSALRNLAIMRLKMLDEYKSYERYTEALKDTDFKIVETEANILDNISGFDKRLLKLAQERQEAVKGKPATESGLSLDFHVHIPSFFRTKMSDLTENEIEQLVEFELTKLAYKNDPSYEDLRLVSVIKSLAKIDRIPKPPPPPPHFHLKAKSKIKSPPPSPRPFHPKANSKIKSPPPSPRPFIQRPSRRLNLHRHYFFR